MMGNILVLLDHDRGVMDPVSFQAIKFATRFGCESVHVALIGSDAARLADVALDRSSCATWLVEHPALSDFAPEAWADAVVALAKQIEAVFIVGPGTERGNEVLAHVAAALNTTFVSNVTSVDLSRGADVNVAAGAADQFRLTRARWGGSLSETVLFDHGVQSEPRLVEREKPPLEPVTAVLSCAPHAFDAASRGSISGEVQRFTPELRDNAARTRVKDRITLGSGMSLQTAPVVVSGGRGVGSAEAFGPLDELAELLGGAVGCSRVVTNQGWRPHADQVGQTGKRVAPALYIACGISGAIQHWIGMKAAENVFAINLDKDAPMVTKADYAVIGDLHEVVPAIVEELKRRRG